MTVEDEVRDDGRSSVRDFCPQICELAGENGKVKLDCGQERRRDLTSVVNLC